MSASMAEQTKQNVGEVVRAYGQRLFQFIRGRVPSQSDAEDILQEVWYQLSRVIDTEPIEQISGWLFRVARNKVTDNYRRRRPEALDDWAYEDAEGSLIFKEILLPDNEYDNSPEAEDLRQIFWQRLLESLDELPEAQRQVFVWNELEDQTFQEIADRTGENIKTLISRKRYAVQHLRLRLQDLYEEFFND